MKSIFSKETCVGGVSASRDSSDFGRDEIGRICIPLIFYEDRNKSKKVQNQQDNTLSSHGASK